MSDTARRAPAPLVVLLFCAALGVLVGMIWAVASPVGYRATAKLFVSTQGEAPLIGGAPPPHLEQVRDSYRAVATTPLVLAPVIHDLQLEIPVDRLASRVSVAAPAGSALIDVTAMDASPARAAAIADAVASSLAATASVLTPASQTASVPVHLTVIERASTSGTAAPFVTVLIGLAGGCIAGGIALVLAFLRGRPPTSGLLIPAAS